MVTLSKCQTEAKTCCSESPCDGATEIFVLDDPLRSASYANGDDEAWCDFADFVQSNDIRYEHINVCWGVL